MDDVDDDPITRVAQRYELDLKNEVDSWEEIGLADPFNTKLSLRNLINDT